jgi:hypothetical protein
VYFVLTFLISVVTLPLAQQSSASVPRLGGEWRLDAEKSSPKPPSGITMTLKVVQTDAEVVFERQVVQVDPQAPPDPRLPKTEVLRFIIGLPSLNTDDIGPIRATARWSDGRLVADGVHTMAFGGQSTYHVVVSGPSADELVWEEEITGPTTTFTDSQGRTTPGPTRAVGGKRVYTRVR